MNNTSTIALIAIVAIAGLLIAATALGPTQAFAHKHHKHRHHSSISQHSSASISQKIDQSSVNVGGGSSNNAAANVNLGSATSGNVISR
jgi:hypothetical protein